jgi:isoleucyl-tRNA synthetase
MRDLILEEVNIHSLVYVSEEDDFVQYEVKPQFKIMGPKYGKQMKAITEVLSKLKGKEVLSAFHSSGVFHLSDLGIDLVPEDVVVQIIPREGFVFESMNDKFVALDTTLTPNLLQEGYARELVNKIQYTRKEQNFDILDRIVIEWYGDDDIQAAIDKYKDYIMRETLSDELRRVNSHQDMPVYDINGKEVYLKIYKVDNK